MRCEVQGVRCEPRAAYLAANSSRLSPSSCSRLRCSAAAAHKFVVLMAGWRAGPSPPAPLSVAVVSGSILVVHSGQARVPLAEEPRRLPSCSFERRVTRERLDQIAAFLFRLRPRPPALELGVSLMLCKINNNRRVSFQYTGKACPG